MAKRKESGVTHECEGQSKCRRIEQQPTLPSKGGVENPPKASFLDLPAKLRNRIYGYAFGSGETYTLREPCGKDPALLRCSSQVHREARAIWLENTHFKLIVQNGKFEPHAGHWIWSDHASRRTEVHCEGEPYLDNIRGWFKQLHAGVAPEWSDVRVNDEWEEENQECLEVFAFTHLFDHMAWEDVERTLDLFAETEDDGQSDEEENRSDADGWRWSAVFAVGPVWTQSGCGRLEDTN